MREQTRRFRVQLPTRVTPALLIATLLLTLPLVAQDPALPPTDLALTCIVHDALGHPMSDVAIEIRYAAPPLMRISTRTSSDGSMTFRGLAAGAYDVTVAGALLAPPTRVQVSPSSPPLLLKLPITLPQGEAGQTVSVEQLSVPEKVQETLRKAYEAWERKDIAQSRTLAIRALQLKPYYGPALTLLGILELSEGHPADAIIGLEQAVRYNPNSPRMYLALASAYNELHRNADALNALSLLDKLTPQSWQLHYETGRAHLGFGRYQAALDEFTLAQKFSSQDLTVLHIGKAHAQIALRNYAAARAELETVLRKSPNGPDAAEAHKLSLALDAHAEKASVPANAAAHTPQ
jgi:Flp pilus assembly protein TadD